MTMMKTLGLTAVAGTLLLAGASGAFAADDCAAQVKALTPMVEKLTDATLKTRAQKLLNTAEKEATEEMDEGECLDALKDAKKLLGI